jgi:hypothetical protein
MRATPPDSLLHADGRAAIQRRIDALTPQSKRQWGRMTVQQMVCHLSDGYRTAVGERSVPSYASLHRRTVMKWVALHTTIKWPPGIKTIPESDQQIGGTRPVEFTRDKAELKRLVESFAASEGLLEGRPHALFGALTAWEWGRWGYRHADHHLRQFSV